MKAKRSIRSLLVLAALGTLLGTPDAQDTQAGTQTKEASAKLEPRELSFAVTGLSAENLGKVKEGLMAIKARTYACGPCHVEQAHAGTCAKCQGALKEETRAVFQRVQPSSESGMLALAIDPAASLRLSELESTLAKSMVKLDASRLTLPGRARLIVKGATAETAPTIEKALKDAKLFDEVKSKFDATTNELALIVHAGATAPTRAKVSAALEASKAQLIDVVWGPSSPKS